MGDWSKGKTSVLHTEEDGSLPSSPTNFTPIERYMEKPLEERRRHLDLSKPCFCIFENPQNCNTNQSHRGILGWVLKTTLPRGHKYHLCHACNNHWCSNPYHQYWGTVTENHQDQVQAGTWSNITERTRRKHGDEFMEDFYRRVGSLGGKAGRGRVLTKEHREALSLSLKGKKHSKETRKKMSEKVWIHDGTQTKRIKKSEPIPNGWKLGRNGFNPWL